MQTEIIVPVTVTPLQRQLYRSILERNAAAIESIFHQTVANTKVKVKKANLCVLFPISARTVC